MLILADVRHALTHGINETRDRVPLVAAVLLARSVNVTFEALR